MHFLKKKKQPNNVYQKCAEITLNASQEKWLYSFARLFHYHNCQACRDAIKTLQIT